MADNLELLEQQAAPYNAINVAYRPGKKEREVRRIIWLCYYAMGLDPLRKEAEDHWQSADQAYRQWTPTPDPDDWRANIFLPDAFAAIQAQMQETIDRKSRPLLRSIDSNDISIEHFANGVMQYSLDRTNFDYQMYLAKLSAAIRGTSFIWDYWRVDKRLIEDPTGVNTDGSVKYQTKEVVDFDDDYSQFIENEYVYLDPFARHIDDAIDCIIRQIMHIDEFRRVYRYRPDFINVDYVKAGGDTSSKGFFRQQRDLTTYDVEIFHYYNRANDQYYAMANNVVIRIGPMPSKHKELPLTPIYQYKVPGRMWGMGIPQVIWALTEERRSIRNLNLDRQKMQINKMFLVNDQVEIDEEEAVTRPHGFINVNANGLPLNQIIQPLEYGDVPQSAFKTEEILLEDIRRAHGIDDRIEGNQVGGTATEAAILKESAIKRIQMMATLLEMDSLKRIGRIKWSNIQFFYPVARLERVFDDEDHETVKKSYRKIRINGKEFMLSGAKGEQSLVMNEIDGSSIITLNKSYAQFMQGDFDVEVDADATSHLSKTILQSKVTEMVNLILANPVTAGVLDPKKTVLQLLQVNDQNPNDWMPSPVRTAEQWRMLADQENVVMSAGIPILPTEGANSDHTLEHLHYTKSAEFVNLHPAIKQIFQVHINGEDANNPATAGGMGQQTAPVAPPGGPTATSPNGPSGPLGGGPTPPLTSPTAQQTNQGMMGPVRTPGQMNMQPADVGASNLGQPR